MENTNPQDNAPVQDLPAANAAVQPPVQDPAANAAVQPPVQDPAANAASQPQDQPVAGLGVDIIEIERFEQALKRTPRMAQRLFSAEERDYAQAKARPAVHLALFFAAREAVLKALGSGFAGMIWTDVTVDHDRFGRPYPILGPNASALAAAQGVLEVQLSLSYTHSVGVASAVAIRAQDRPQRAARLDPKADLARQFKEMRALLDEMDGRLSALDETPDESGQTAQNSSSLTAAAFIARQGLAS